jgi:hypothetical protein
VVELVLELLEHERVVEHADDDAGERLLAERVAAQRGERHGTLARRRPAATAAWCGAAGEGVAPRDDRRAISGSSAASAWRMAAAGP